MSKFTAQNDLSAAMYVSVDKTVDDDDVADLDIGFNDEATFVKEINEQLPYPITINSQDFPHLDSRSYSVVGLNNWSLKEIVIPEYFDDGIHGRHPVTSIEGHAFRGSAIKKVVIPPTIICIFNQAFDGCVCLTQVNIPSSVNRIRAYCFDGCMSLKQIYLPISVEHLSAGVFDECLKIEIYTDHHDKPNGWANSWNSADRPVFWAGQWEWINGVPSHI